MSTAAWIERLTGQTDLMQVGIQKAAGAIHAAGPEAEPPKPSPLDSLEWEPWLQRMFPRHVEDGFADHHRDFWAYLWAIRADDAPDPYVGIWPRGGGKSTSAEMATVAVGLRGVRRYGWYIRETQERADDSLANIAALLEGSEVERYYPAHAERMLSKYGHSKGWNSTRLRTAGGFTVDAVGLDTARRGLKIEDVRPDFMVLDDIDGKHDNKRATRKKLDTITTSVLPAGTDRTAVLAIQNVIIPHGIFARLADGRAEFLATRKVSGPIPSLRNMQTEVRDWGERRRTMIVAGEPTWAGQDVDKCQRLMDKIGPRAFLAECQHEVGVREGALWKADDIDHIDECPPLKRVVVGVDPSGGGDEIGIIIVGIGYDGRLYVIADMTQPGHLGSLNWGRAAVRGYDDHEADKIVAESNFGGDMVKSNVQVAAGDRRVPVKMVPASRGKAVRAEPVASLYEDGLVSHVGVFPELEAEMTGWVQGDPDSPNRLDGLVWAVTELALGGAKRLRVAS